MLLQKKRKIIYAILVALLIYLSNGVFPVLYISALYRALGVIIICLMLSFYSKRARLFINRSSMIMAILFIGLQAISFIVNGIEVQFDFFLIVSITAALIFTSTVSKEQFTEAYRTVICIISVVSVFLFAVGYFFPTVFMKIPSQLLKSAQWDNTHIILGTFLVRNRLYSTYYRNFGIFSEPGQYQLFLNVGLFLELFVAEKLSIRHVIILLITLVTCNSTNGFIVTILLITAYFLNNYTKLDLNKRKKRKSLLVLLGISFLLVVTLYRNELLGLIEASVSKIINMKTDYSYSDLGTGLERKRAFDVALKALAQNPITGLGYKGLNNYIQQLNANGFIMTFSPLNWFARHGIFYGLLANYFYICFYTHSAKKTVSKFILIIAAVMIISAQAVNADIFTWVIMFYSIQKWKTNGVVFADFSENNNPNLRNSEV